jgi:hypothetical protein
MILDLDSLSSSSTVGGGPTDLHRRQDLWPMHDRLHDHGWIDQMILIIDTMATSTSFASVIAAMNTGQGPDLLGVCLGSHAPLSEPVGEMQ